MSKFANTVYKIIQNIPYGKVVSYGQVAIYAGVPRGARQVGWILHQSEGKIDLPWWRVINNAGRITIKGSYYNSAETQRKLLLAEGVKVEENLDIDIEKYRWIPNKKVMQ